MQSICNVFQDDLVLFVQFKKREKYPWKRATLLKVTLLHGCCSRFSKLYKWYQIAQRIYIKTENSRTRDLKFLYISIFYKSSSSPQSEFELEDL